MKNPIQVSCQGGSGSPNCPTSLFFLRKYFLFSSFHSFVEISYSLAPIVQYPAEICLSRAVSGFKSVKDDPARDSSRLASFAGSLLTIAATTNELLQHVYMYTAVSLLLRWQPARWADGQQQQQHSGQSEVGSWQERCGQ